MNKSIAIAALLLQAAAAGALEDARPAAPGTEQQAVVPAAPRSPFAYEDELRETAKYLSLALEYGDRLPADTLKGLGRDCAKFTGALKKALGKGILEEAGAREKALENERRTAAAKTALAALRGALQLSYARNGGKYPAHPAELVPERLEQLPSLQLPDHERTSETTVIGPKKRYSDPGKAVTDDGGWLYFSGPGPEYYGLLLINCSHKDPEGRKFYEY